MIKKSLFICKILIIGSLFFHCSAKKRTLKRNKESISSIPTENKEIKKTIPSKNISEKTTLNTDKSTLVRGSHQHYIKTFYKSAITEMDLYGIPASITLAQGLLESNRGKSRLATQANNHFGIKCHKWNGDVIYHDDDAAQECFRKYDNPKASFRDHSLFLKHRKRYAFLFELSPKDYKEWAYGLRKAGYATDKKYPQKLIHLIEKYRLYEYDNSASYKKESPSLPKQKTYIVKAGDTLYSISKKYNIDTQLLKKANQKTGTLIQIGEVLIIPN